MTQARPHLKRAISGVGFFALAFGSMIGVGWITTLNQWFLKAGPGGAIIAFSAGGILILLIGLCYAELTSMFPVTGGEVAYSYRAFGTSKAFLIGWFLTFGYLSVSAFEAVSIGIVLTYLFPQLETLPLYTVRGSTVYASHLGLGFIFTAAITWINYLGVHFAMRAQIFLTGMLIVSTLFFVASGIIGGHTRNLNPLLISPSLASNLEGILSVFVMAPFWFVGFDTIAQASEERVRGQRVQLLGYYIILSIVGSAVFYILVMIAVGMASPWQTIVQQKLPTAAAFESAFESTAIVNLVLLTGVIGLLTSWNGFFIAGTRVLFALGRAKIIDKRWGQVHHRHGTPSSAILVSGLITTLAACLGKGALIAFVNVGSFCIAIAFFGVSLSLIRLRTTAPELSRPYRLPAAKLIALSAMAGSVFILAAMLVPWSPASLSWPLEWVILIAVTASGIVVWIRGGKTRRQISETERTRLVLEHHSED